MEMMIERRCDLEGRVPMRLPIEVEHIGQAAPFEADAIDVSTGGLSMRTHCLPDVGTHLACRFAVVTGGATVTAMGEVVWAKDGGLRGGEFGVRFVELAPEQKMLVAEMMAEQAARRPAPADAGGPTPASRAAAALGQDASHPECHASMDAPLPSGEVTLDMGHAAISGMLTSCDASGASVEQPLDMLALGQGLWLEGEGGVRRHAHISSVSLRVEGKTPTLALQVAYDDEGRSDSTLIDQAQEAMPFSLQESMSSHDTTPDLTPPTWTEGQRGPCSEEEGAVSAQQRDTMSEFLLDSTSGAEPAPGSEELANRIAHANAVHQPTASEREVEQEEPARLELSLEPEIDPGAERPDGSISFELPKITDLAVDEEPGSEAPPRRRLTAAQFRAALDASPLFREGGPWLRWVAYAARLSEQVRRQFAGTSSDDGARGMMTASAQGLLNRVGQSVSSKKRRTAGRARKVSVWSQVKQRLPIVIVGLLVVSAAALLSYALEPDEDPLLASPVQGNGDVGTAGAPSALVAAARVAPIVPRVESDVRAVRPTARKTVVQPQVTAAAAPPAGGHTRSGPSFGAESVPAAKTFTLRMTNPVTTLEGVADAGGFTVTIPGSLSRDPAGPFASQHGSIQRSMILNKDGSRAELTIRFNNGLKPPYRVEAHGAELRILVGLP